MDHLDETEPVQEDPATEELGQTAEPEARLPSLPARLVGVFVSPGRLMEQLVAQPKWLGALLVSTVVVGISMSLLPIEIFIEMQRAAAIERGVDFPAMSDGAIQIMRFALPAGAVVSTLFISLVFAGFYTLVFAFVLGDEGRFKQYLAVIAHAWFIPSLFGLLLTPLRISTEDPQFTLNLASFLVFLPDGYLLNVFRVLDLTQIWSTLVIAQGLHTIDRRRSFGSAATILFVILLLFALVGARFM